MQWYSCHDNAARHQRGKVSDMQLASPFRGITPSGERILHSGNVDPGEVALIKRFIDGGGPVMWTQRKGVDLLDPGRGRVVPTIYRTDGAWVWFTGIYYYLETHGTPLDPKFLTHIRRQDFVSATPDSNQISQAIRFLKEPAARDA
ncbi:hypothetical protein GPX89_30800 [Nocardia sp. ET3-3]|uniref:Uncharacterized protein n=1 Tax=Nocardia terrae TaxID=2675851 RepID=A0A7K1V4T6_9NOCA|nr:hypothetical protein [Nocardia terrae]